MDMVIWAMNKFFTQFAGSIAFLAGKPLTFIIAMLLVLIWAATGPMFAFSEVWQLVINTGTTIVTFLMVFLVQNSQNRDASAMQAKLDELIRVIERARPEFIGIEHLTDKEIEQIREVLESDGQTCGNGKAPSREAVSRLLSRR